jgi:hypothetical protein
MKNFEVYICRAFNVQLRLPISGFRVYFSPLKMNLVLIIFKNLVRTSKRTPHFTIKNISWLTLFKEVITVYTKNRTKFINAARRVTVCKSRWYIQLPFGFKGLNVHSPMVYYVYVLLHNAAKQFMYYHFPLSLLRKENCFVFFICRFVTQFNKCVFYKHCLIHSYNSIRVIFWYN